MLCVAQLGAATNGVSKFIASNNKGVTAVQISTSRGNFLLDGLQLPNAAVIFSQSHWKKLAGFDPTWFVDMQQGSALVVSGSTYLGSSTALSADGNTLAAGAFLTIPSNTGATYIFTRSGATWTSQGGELQDAAVNIGAWQGWAVAISADGNKLAVGAYKDGSGGSTPYKGSVSIYTRSGTSWTLQTSRLTPSDAVQGTNGAQFGYSVSLSADGNTLAVGGNIDNSGPGAAWIFTQTAGAWTQQGSKILPSGEVGNGQFGTSVAISADGNTLAVGGMNDNGIIGAVWIFIRLANGLWQQQGVNSAGAKLVPNDGINNPYVGFGTSVALSADGNTLAVGAKNDNVNIGATWVFIRTNGVWTQQSAKLVGTGYVPYQSQVYQGSAVSLSADGNTLAIGGPYDNNINGAAWIFVRRNGLWTQMGKKLPGTGAMGMTALSADGNTLAAGAQNGNQVFIWV